MWKLVDGDINNTNAKTAFEGMRAGDELAKRLIDKYVEYVACGLTNVINIFQPEIVCIGGGVSREARPCWTRCAVRWTGRTTPATANAA